jgi:hypothetical protein
MKRRKSLGLALFFAAISNLLVQAVGVPWFHDKVVLLSNSCDMYYASLVAKLLLLFATNEARIAIAILIATNAALSYLDRVPLPEAKEFTSAIRIFLLLLLLLSLKVTHGFGLADHCASPSLVPSHSKALRYTSLRSSVRFDTVFVSLKGGSN